MQKFAAGHSKDHSVTKQNKKYTQTEIEKLTFVRPQQTRRSELDDFKYKHAKMGLAPKGRKLYVNHICHQGEIRTMFPSNCCRQAKI